MGDLSSDSRAPSTPGEAGAATGPAPATDSSRRGMRLRALLRSPSAIFASVVLGLVTVVVIIGPGPWKEAATTMDVPAARQGPSSDHWFGTDELGRDIFARVMMATRISVLLGLAATAIGAAIGIGAGTVTGVLGRRGRRWSARAITLAIAFPGVLTALIVTAILGAGKVGAVLAIGFALAPGFARLSQTLTASVAGSDYFAAGRLLGISRRRLVRRYLLPNTAEPLIVATCTALGEALLAIAALSYLGLGVQLPEFDWGALLGDGLKKIYETPAAAIAPGLAVVITGLGFNVAGEAIAGVMSPRSALRRRGHGTAATCPAEPTTQVATTQEPEQADDMLLDVRRLSVRFATQHGWVSPVRDVSLAIGRAEMIGIVGESGSGKSLTASAIAQLLPAAATATSDRLVFDGRRIRPEHTPEQRRLLGTKLAVVFQDPMSSLNPARRIGPQLSEKVRTHLGLDRRQARAAAVAALTEVQIDEPERRLRQYPHELSGGMRQRVMIAMGLMGRPDLIIADEPTTALDVTVQAQIIELLHRANTEHGTAVMLISHDVSVVNAVCTRIVVMYAGRIVEDGSRDQVITRPRHPYTDALMAAIPTLDTDRDIALPTIPGQPPAPAQHVIGCAFATRCSRATDRCRVEEPELTRSEASNSAVACWHPIGMSA